MEDLLEQIERASESGLYYVALLTALTVPDLCSSLEAPNGQHGGNRYMKWVETHLPGWKDPGSGKLLWQFRSSLLHEGHGRHHERSKAPRLIFVEPGAPLRVHMGYFTSSDGQSAMMIDVPTFSAEVVTAARKWLDSVRGTEPFEKNFRRFVRRYPAGIPPFIVGVPVIG